MPSVTLRTARKARQCGYYPCDETIERGALFARHVGFPGDDGVSGETPWVIEQCRVCADRQGKYVRDQYGVPAAFGMRVEVDGRPGRIYGFDSGIRVLGDDGSMMPAHPTWRVVYHAADGPQAFGMEG